MAFDPVVSLRIINNERLRRAQGWAEHRDLGGAIAVTSDGPLGDLNCIEAFSTSEARVEGLLDIGFALLRAFDREPAARITALDRPKSLGKRLQRRRLRVTTVSNAMVFRSDPGAVPANPEIEVRRAGPEDAPAFVRINAGHHRWAKRALTGPTMEAMNDPANFFYLAYAAGEPVATTQMLIDGSTAGIYAVATLRAHRQQGIATTLLARALRDASDANCDVIGLRTIAGSDAERLYTRYGFELAHEVRLWETPTA